MGGSVWRARRPSPSSVGGLGLKKIKTRAGSPSLITSMARLLFSSASRKYWRSRRIFPCRRVQSARRCRVQRLARRRRSGLHRSPDWRRLDDHKNSKEIIKSELSLPLGPPNEAASLFCNTGSATKSAKPASSREQRGIRSGGMVVGCPGAVALAGPRLDRKHLPQP